MPDVEGLVAIVHGEGVRSDSRNRDKSVADKAEPLVHRHGTDVPLTVFASQKHSHRSHSCAGELKLAVYVKWTL